MGEDMKNRGDPCPQLLDLIPHERDWMVRDGGGVGGSLFRAEEEKKLELRLAPPGGEDWPPLEKKSEEESSVLSLRKFPQASKTITTSSSAGAKRVFLDTVRPKTEGLHQQQQTGFLLLQHRAGLGKELSQRTNGKAGQQQQQSPERKACCPPPAHAAPGKAAGANDSSQKRLASVPVVGWPPIRSFRKNLASSSCKPSIESQNGSLETKAKDQNWRKGLFVKINMDGVPIGRKVDLKAYDSYEKLSLAAEELFRGLLAAQRDPSASEDQKNADDKQAFTGLRDGSGEYTLVYEDNDGDRMLVEDVPWDMFVSTAKRLRLLKTSELSALSLGAVGRKGTATGC